MTPGAAQRPAADSQDTPPAPGTGTPPAIDITGLRVRLGGREVLRGVSLALAPGARVAVVGPNGAGKTTLLRAAAGLVRPRAGAVRFHGGAAGAAAASFGFLGHRPHVYPYLTARENLAFAARLYGLADAQQRIDASLHTVGLAADAERLPREYSRGMLQRLGLAAALLPEPAVVLLDEPDASLDRAGLRGLPAMLDALAPGAAVLFSTHDEHVARSLNARVVHMRRGRLDAPPAAAPAVEPAAAANPPARPRRGFAAAAAVLIAKDLRVEWRAREQAPTMLVFALLAALVFDMAFIAVLHTEAAAVAAGVLWASLVLAATLGGVRLFASEHDRGTLDGLLVAPIDPSSIYAAKLAVLTLETAFVGLVQLGFVSLLLNVPLLQGVTVGAVLLASAGMSAVVALQSALVVNARAREVLLPLLALPLSFPILLAGVGLTLGALQVTPDAAQGPWFGLLAAAGGVSLSLGVVLYPFAART